MDSESVGLCCNSNHGNNRSRRWFHRDHFYTIRYPCGNSGTQGGSSMKAVALIPGTSTVRMIDIPEPAVTSPDDVKVRILGVGICGTDREEASGGRALAPQGQKELVVGHEMFGQVVETGKSVT